MTDSAQTKPQRRPRQPQPKKHNTLNHKNDHVTREIERALMRYN